MENFIFCTVHFIAKKYYEEFLQGFTDCFFVNLILILTIILKN